MMVARDRLTQEKNVKTGRSAIAGLVLAGALGVAGCGGADVNTRTTATTTGQELMDLKQAYDSGVISEKEYQRKREEILQRD